jgi:hypothetical protein
MMYRKRLFRFRHTVSDILWDSKKLMLCTRLDVEKIDTRTQRTPVSTLLCAREAQRWGRIEALEYARDVLLENMTR